jgi:plastocyanin
MALTLGSAAAPAASQSLLDRTPNVSGGWVSSPGVVHFNFLHRFTTTGAPERQVLNSPTFLLAYAPISRSLLGASYATRSDITPRFPNEWELFGRYAPLTPVSLQVSYNNAAESVDGEVSVTHTVGGLRLLAAGRVLSRAFASDSARLALAGGAALRLTRWVAITGDVATMVSRRDNEDLAWGAALQIAIPYTPHTLSLQAANTSTATLQGASRGAGRTRYGFEFTVPLTLARWFGRKETAVGDAALSGAVVVVMQNLQFSPRTVVVAAGQQVVWRNDDQVAHTVTAQDGSWTSALLPPGATYVHTFAEPGNYAITCTPHPFMKSTVQVQP